MIIRALQNTVEHIDREGGIDMIALLPYVIPFLLVGMGSVSLVICVQAIRLMVPYVDDRDEHPTDQKQELPCWPVFSAGGCAIDIGLTGSSKDEMLITSAGSPAPVREDTGADVSERGGSQFEDALES